MIQKIRNQNVSHKAFTLIEMVIVLIIMGIMLMFTTSLSGDQIQKVKNKTVKESILSEMQTCYSRNLGSSSFGGKMYDTLEVSFMTGENKIDFRYKNGGEINLEKSFTDFFKIRYLTFNSDNANSNGEESVTIKYSPYKISCKIGESDKNKNLVIITRVNNNKDYCFEIKQKNCRLVEMTEESCNNLIRLIES